MKPEQWIIDDIGRLRKTQDRTDIENSYLELLLWYVKLLKQKD